MSGVKSTRRTMGNMAVVTHPWDEAASRNFIFVSGETRKRDIW